MKLYSKMAMDTFSVSELTSCIKKNLEKQFCFLQVQGEVSNLTIHSSGHIYFTLKDASSQISCAFFKQARKKKEFSIKNGDLIVVKGDLSVYPPRGSYQIIVREAVLAGLGALLLQFHKTKEALQKEGLFDAIHKKPLPAFPKKLGVITSCTGAVIQDILQVLRRRYPGFQLLLFPVKVQGETAAYEIATAINECCRVKLCDLLIIARGGGSLEDLWAFNEVIVAKAVFACSIPTISAVGHETDHTICDLVADVRAPTPSAAAEIAVREKQALLEYLQEKKKTIACFLQEKIIAKRRNLALLTKLPHVRDPSYFLAKWAQKLDEKAVQIKEAFARVLEKNRTRFSYLKKAYQDIPQKTIERKKQELLQMQRCLKAMDPNRPLQKGYALLFSEDTGLPIVSVKEMQVGDSIKTKIKDGTITTTIKNITKGPSK